jgi:DNA helicase-2/ATP-dependent DNA helicase PcrA
VTGAPQPPHLDRLNAGQLQAVTALDGAVLVLAGAGSGKTRVLTRRIAHLLHTGAHPESILAVTFTNKAASEMKERVVELVGEIGRKIWVSTFHSSCGRILRADIEPLGWTRRFTIYDDDDQVRLMRQLIVDRGLDPRDRSPEHFLAQIDRYKNALMTVDDVLASRRSRLGDPLLELWRDYEESLKASDAVDFNDLIGLVVRLFEEHPDVAARWRERFQYVLVDEYQDTNRAQYRVLQLLVREHGNLCCVGDDDQSIYGFRGADIRNILDFQQDHPSALTVRMEQNYRCSKNILAVANAVVARNSGRIEKKLWTLAEDGPLVNVLVAPDPPAEARLVARAIQQLHGDGFAYGDMVILYRSNSTARIFEKELAAARIPHRVIGGRSFRDRREVRDAIAYLRLIVNPADDASFLRVCNVPVRGLGPAALSAVREAAATRGEPLLATARALSQGEGGRARAFASFVQLIDDLALRARDLPGPALVRELLDRSGYAAMLDEDQTADGRARRASLHELLQRATAIEEQAGTGGVERLQAWLDVLALDERAAEEAEDAARTHVALMTVHTSKGLEFPVVFVVQMMEGTFPHHRSLDSEAGIEEERRLAYVAFTRAQRRLVATRSRQLPSRPGAARRNLATTAPPSRFLFGLPGGVVVGDVPSLGTRPAEGGDPLRVTDERLRRFIGRNPSATIPDDLEITTADVEALDQLRRDVRVFDPRRGLGRVLEVAGTAAAPRVRIAFDEGGAAWLNAGDATLQLVLRESSTARD